MSGPTPPLSELDGTMQIVARFEEARAADPALAEAELDELKRLVPGKRAMLSGRWQGRAAIFRMHLDPASHAPGNEWAEMTRAWPHMQGKTLRIAEPLHVNEEFGLLVIEDIPGTPLMQHMWHLDPADRAPCLPQAAAWLRAYTAHSEITAKPRAAVWLNKAAAAAATQPHPKLQRRERKILRHLTRLAPLCDDLPWRHAISHGDFHPNNLIVGEDRLTGIDLGGSATIPIYKDMARFLMHMGRRGLIPSGEARFGVDARGIDAFAGAFSLSAQERDLILPFMLGVEALIRVEHAGIKRGRVRRAAEMSDRLIADLGTL